MAENENQSKEKRFRSGYRSLLRADQQVLRFQNLLVNISQDDPIAIAVVSAIRQGDVAALERVLRDRPNLATALIVDGGGVERSLLHIATDWPGHFPVVDQTIRVLIAAGANLNARAKTETALHWAASSDDVIAIDALLDGGADIEAPGAIFTGGTAMSDAVVFAQWNAARRLLERGAETTLWQAAALGLFDRVQQHFVEERIPTPDEITNAFWHACRGGQQSTAEYLRSRGANLNWIGYDHRTPLAAAQDSGNQELANWLREYGAKLAGELV